LPKWGCCDSFVTMSTGPVDVVERKGIKIPIYSSPVGGRENYIVVYYAGGVRKRDRAGTTLHAARAFANTKIDELTRGVAHVGTLTLKQAATVSDAVDVLKVINIPLSRAVREYSDAYKILGRQPLIVEAARHYARHMEDQKSKAELAPITLPQLVEKFMEDLRERKKSRRYVYDMQAKLARAASVFTGQVANITTDAIDMWLKSLKGTSALTKNNYRKALAVLFSFARKKGHLPRGKQTEVEFSARYNDKGGQIGVYSPAELDILLTNIERRFVPFVAIAGFAGVRSSEIARLSWDDVRWQHGDIELKRGKAKTVNRRLAPLLPCLRAWLEPFRKNKGPVLEGIRDEFDLAKRFRQAVDAMVDSQGNPLIKLVHNGLRHSFITYRMAVLKNAAEVSLEAGNSPSIVFRHYRELRTEKEGKEWFSVMPQNVNIFPTKFEAA
jgi:integrase